MNEAIRNKMMQILGPDCLNQLSIQQQMAIDNCIGMFLVGSHLYGTNTEKSDKDYEAIFVESPEFVIGTKHCDEVNFSTNKSNTKNSSEDKDIKFYSLRKYIALAMDNNPNKIEYLFCPERNIVYKDKYWEKILANINLFVSLKLKHSFTGYASSQRHKLLTKKRRLEEFREFKKVLEEGIAKGARIIGDLDITEIQIKKEYDAKQDTIIQHKSKVLKAKYQYITYTVDAQGSDALKVDTKTYNYGMDIQNIYEQINHELDKYGSRTIFLKEYGMDVKFASHIFRLYYEGLQLLKEGKLDFPLHENKFLLDIKQGMYDLEYLIKRTDDFEPLFEQAYLISTLPKSPDQDAVHKLQQELITGFWREHNLI